MLSFSVSHLAYIFQCKHKSKRMDKFRVAPRPIRITQPSFREKSKTLASSENRQIHIPFNPASHVMRIRIRRIRMCLGPPGSGSRSVSQRYGSGSASESFYPCAKLVRITTILWLLCDLSSLKNDINVPSKRNKLQNLDKNSFLLASWRSIAGSGYGFISQRHRSADPDPYPKCRESATLLSALQSSTKLH